MGEGFQGLTVAAFESRLAEAMRAMIARHGGTPLIAPALREVPLSEHHDALTFADRLFAHEVEILICLTGVGLRTLTAAIGTQYPLERFRQALKTITVVARGPKPAAVLREMGVSTFLAVPEPNTWHELLALLDTHAPVAGKRVAVQEYGASNADLLDALRARGADVLVVPVYRWALPNDTGPLRQAIHAIAEGRVEVALFTNATQVEHLHRVAVEEQAAEAVARAMGRMVIGSIGPIASHALRQQAYPVDLEPSHPKMGILVQETAARAPDLLRRKRPAA